MMMLFAAYSVTSPRMRGEVDLRTYVSKSGEGAWQHAEHIDAPPHPARGCAARHPLPANGERESAEAAP
jgi:hypothetical protein